MDRSDIGKSGDGFIDRSRVRILLCDNDEKSSEEILTLLCGCSYQVTSVKSPRQVIDALNAEGPDIDIILSEVDLPMSKGLKMLKYITRDKALRRIPMIMMSAQDEVPIVVKCLKLGAADYLVKPLRTNELLNLWTHVWRRRRLLGLVEKNIINYDFDMVVSDQSDGNTNSTTLFSDDTDDRAPKSSNPEAGASVYQEEDISALTVSPVATPLKAPHECQPDVPGISDRRTGQMPSFPKKSELKIGESSAFFTYVKSSTSKSNSRVSSVHGNRHQNPKTGENPIPENEQAFENHCADGHPSPNGVAELFSMEKSSTSPMSLNISKEGNSKDFALERSRFRNDPANGVNSFMHHAYPYYPGVMSQAAMPSASVYQHANPALLPHYNQISQCPPPMPPGMAAYSYYPFGMCLQPGQIPAPHPWPMFENQASKEVPLKKVDRREAALMKFRQKRKERCFDKKIRYVNRKKLAERRPRLRGQFVRKVNGVIVDLNGRPASAEDGEEEDEEVSDDDDQMESLPQHDATSCQQ